MHKEVLEVRLMHMSISESPSRLSGTGSPGHMEGKRTIGTSRTGIHDFLDGSIPRGKSLIYYAQPGAEGEVFGMQTAYNTLSNGGTCVFVASSTSPGIINLLRKTSASTIVFGSLSTIMDLCGEKETIEAVRLWNTMAALYGHVLVYNFTAWPYSHDTLSLIKKDLFNAVISIGGMTKNVITGKCFSVLKSDWMNNMRTRCYSGY